MAKDAGSDQKTAGKRAAKGRQPEGEEGGVLALTREGAGKPVALVKRWYQAAEQFLREVRTELKKVTWPGRKETLASTGVVLIIVFFVAVYLGLVDLALSRLIGALLR
jgi:preprotein translocase subunit SecE